MKICCTTSSGRPLATNEAAFSVEIDDSITVDFEDSDAEAASLYNKIVKNKICNNFEEIVINVCLTYKDNRCR